MYCWGNSTHHELYVEGPENNDLVIKPSPSKWREAGSVRSVWAGEFHVLYLTASGALYSSGSNGAGQLGRPTPGEDGHCPGLVEFPAGTRIVSAACGAQHSLALDEWGQPYAWGSDCLGQLGTATGADSQDKPKIVKTLATRNVVQIACGAYHSLALTNNGEVWCWGSNVFGQCGLGTCSSREGPQPLALLLGVPLGHITAGLYHSFAVSKSGAVFGWGKNNCGQLGLSDRENRSHPTHLKSLRNAKVCYVSCGEEFSAFLTREGGVFTCGGGGEGQTGHGGRGAGPELVPRQVAELMGGAVTALAAGRRHLLCAAGAGPGPGRVLACGHGARGQLGLGGGGGQAAALLPTPVPIAPHPTQPLGGSSAVSAGWDHSFVLAVAARPDLRVSDPAGLPLALQRARLGQCVALPPTHTVSQDLMVYLETVFGSLACMNGSFLGPGDGHYGCGPRNPGVDLAEAREAFTMVARIENDTIKDLILSLVCSALVPALQRRPWPAGAEAVRAALWLPLYGAVRSGRSGRALAAPLAAALCRLPAPAQRLAHAWWAAAPPDYFRHLVDTFKSVVVYEIMQPHLGPAKKVTLSPEAVQLLDFLALLNRLNCGERGAGARPLVPPETFYIEELSAHFDIATDYFNWLSDQDCSQPHLCNYAFVFDAGSKARLLRVDQALQQHAAACRGSPLLSLPPGLPPPEDACLHLLVRRQHLVRDAVHQISAHDSAQLKKPLRVTFVGEEAEDAGGVRKEFFLLLLRDILDPVYGMFRPGEDGRVLWFSEAPLEDDSMYYLIGAIFGLAIYNSIIISVPFPLALYRKLLGEPVSLQDVADLQPTLARSLKQLLDYEGEDVEEVFGLVFAVSTVVFDAVVTHELRAGGSSQPVTADSKQEYVDLYVDFLLNKSVESQFSSFYQGFQKVCGGRIVKLFRPRELQEAVTGSEAYDWAALEAAAQYRPPYRPSEPPVCWFWEVFHELSDHDKKRFLLFLTGSDRVPVTGMADIKISIQPVGDERRFPVAHTCFNLLDLPRYRTKERLRYCLRQALCHTEGFSLV